MLILRLHPHLTVWFHQHLDMVWASGGNRRTEKVFARVSSLPYHPMPQLAGSAISWQNNTLPGTTAFAAELPAGEPAPCRSPATCARYSRPHALRESHGGRQRSGCLSPTSTLDCRSCRPVIHPAGIAGKNRLRPAIAGRDQRGMQRDRRSFTPKQPTKHVICREFTGATGLEPATSGVTASSELATWTTEGTGSLCSCGVYGLFQSGSHG
jgi:hypothetical protein